MSGYFGSYLVFTLKYQLPESKVFLEKLFIILKKKKIFTPRIYSAKNFHHVNFSILDSLEKKTHLRLLVLAHLLQFGLGIFPCFESWTSL